MQIAIHEMRGRNLGEYFHVPNPTHLFLHTSAAPFEVGSVSGTKLHCEEVLRF